MRVDVFRAYRYTWWRYPTQGEERWMLYGDRGYCIAHARSRTKEALGWASTSGGGDDCSKKEDKDVPERLGASGAGRGLPAIRPRRLRSAR